MDRNRKDNRVPLGLSLLMWPALLRAPWLMSGFTERDEERRREEYRRKHDR